MQNEPAPENLLRLPWIWLQIQGRPTDSLLQLNKAPETVFTKHTIHHLAKSDDYRLLTPLLSIKPLSWKNISSPVFS